jgi:hypothetical protein
MKKLTPVLFLLITCACKKDKDRTEEVSGILLHSITGAPIAGQEVIMYLDVTEAWLDNEILKTTSDAAGKFHFAFKVEGKWQFSVDVKDGLYISKNYGEGIYAPDPYDMSYLRAHFDTIYVEQPAFVKYTIRNTNDQFANDSLYVSTPYRRMSMQAGQFFDPNSASSTYNWLFAGKNIDFTLIDTIPGESLSDVEIKWAYMRGKDTISKHSKMVTLSPRNQIEHNIEY